MQSKGAIQFFAIAFVLVCLYQLSFTWQARSVEEEARELSNGNIEKEAAFLDSIANEPVFNFGIKKYTYKECKDREINLGLDLKGGMNVTLEVSVIDVIKSMANYSTDTTFNQAIAEAVKMQRESEDDFTTLFGKAFQTIDPNGQLAAIFSTRENQDRIKYNSTNEEILKIISTEAADAVNRTFDILRARIDKFGVSQPNIQMLETTGRILVELPGIKEPKRVRKLLQGTAKLEFWETYENREIYGFLAEANDKLRTILTVEKNADVDTTTQITAESTKEDSGEDDSINLLDLASNTDEELTDSAEPDTALSLLDQIGSDTSLSDTAGLDQSFAAFAKENPLLSILRPALYEEEGRYFPAKGPVVGYAAIKDTAKINSHLKLDQLKSIFPRDVKFLWTAKPYDEEGNYVQLIAIKISSREGRAPLEGDVIVDARQEFGQFSNKPEISMSMNGEGAMSTQRLLLPSLPNSPRKLCGMLRRGGHPLLRRLAVVLLLAGEVEILVQAGYDRGGELPRRIQRVREEYPHVVVEPVVLSIFGT